MFYTSIMNHTPEIKKAIQFAAHKHHGQMRIAHDGPMPYITHLFSVALLVAEDGASDDVVIAALLHDTLEDTDTTRAELAEAFGEHVAMLVEAVTESFGKDLSWKDRKQAYLSRIEEADPDALLIAIADKIDNIEDRIAEHEKEGETFFSHWSQPNEEYLWFYTECLRIAENRLPDQPLTKRLREIQAHQLAVFSSH